MAHAGRGIKRKSKKPEAKALTPAERAHFDKVHEAFTVVPKKKRPGVLTPLGHRMIERDKSGKWVKTRYTKFWKSIEPFLIQINWIEENLWIVTKESKRIRFRFNEVQSILLNHVCWCYVNNVPVRVIVPKARQLGISTFVQALIFSRCFWRDGYTACVISHDEKSVAKIFKKARVFEKYLPKIWAERNQFSEQQKASYTWEHLSTFRVNSIKTGDGIEMGDTLNAVHCSEVANWSDRGVDAHQAWTSANEAIPSTDPNTFVFWESTAKGQDAFFYPSVELARRGESNYHLFFLPWFLMPEYSMTWEEYRQQRAAHGHDPGEKFVPTEEETTLREKVRGDIGKLDDANREHFRYYQYELSDEQLIWRRYKVQFDLRGRIADFHRFYPSWLEQAFETSSQSFFDGATIDSMKNNVRPVKLRGDVIPSKNGAEFEVGRTGALQVWKEPVPGEKYVIGVDVASGSARSDFSCATVVKKSGSEVVAIFHNRIDPDHFADYLALLGDWYNNAYLVIERNYAPTCAVKVARLGYRNMYWFRDETGFARNRGTKPGFSTNIATRRMLMDALREGCRPSETQTKHPDKEFVNEASAFVWNGKKGTQGKYEAAPGRHDDRVMSLALALYCCLTAPEEELTRKTAEDDLDPVYAAYLAEEEYFARRRRFLSGQSVSGAIYL